MQSYQLDFKPNEVICREGDVSTDLFFLKSGKLLICTMNGTQVKALARISPGEFIGELSFFDGKTRSSYIIALEQSRMLQIPKQELDSQLPLWYVQLGKNLTKKIRLLDHVIQEANIRHSNSEENKPLTIDEQRQFYSILTNHST